MHKLLEYASSNVNLLVTIAKKQILKMTQMLHDLEYQIPKIKFSSLDKTFATIPYLPFPNAENYKKVDINGIPYVIDMFIVTDLSQHEKEFGKITKLMKIENEIFLLVKLYDEIIFNEHYHAYVIQQKSEEEKLFNYKDLPNVPPCLSVLRRNVQFVVTRYVL